MLRGHLNEPRDTENAVLSIQNMFIKEERNDRMQESLFDEIEIIQESSPSDFCDSINHEELVSSTSNISGNSSNYEENMIPEYNKVPIELSFYKTPSKVKLEHPHFVKLVKKEGKHTKVWECGICSKEFGHQYTLMRHLPTHTDERRFQCNTCGKAFRQMSTLSQHRAIHSTDRPYICEVCQKTFNRVSTLISHRKTHTGFKPHKCHLCNKAFHQKGNLRNHIFTHTNERPYKCDVCGKGFNQMSNLMCHKSKAHQRADKPRYKCETCGMDFSKRTDLRNHEQWSHGFNNSYKSISTFPIIPSLEPTRGKINGVLVEPITTKAMLSSLEAKETPFALLRPITGAPVLVRVLPAGNKQMLVAATANDLRRHGQITITSASENSSKTEVLNNVQINARGSSTGSTVQIRIPVVATVVQRQADDGTLLMAVEGPEVDENKTPVVLTSHNFDPFKEFSDSETDPPIIYEDQNDTNLSDELFSKEVEVVEDTEELISEEEYHLSNFDLIPYDGNELDTFIGQTIDVTSNDIEDLDSKVDIKTALEIIEAEMTTRNESFNVKDQTITFYADSESSSPREKSFVFEL